jgi:hypothetical protein
MIQTLSGQVLSEDDLQDKATPCDALLDGAIGCEREAGHKGQHAAADSFDDEGRIDGAITWNAAPLVRTSPEGFPLNEDGEYDVPAMTPQQLGDFWIAMDAKERMMKDLIGGYKSAARLQAEALIRERRAANPKAVEIPHASLLIAMQDDYTPYRYDSDPETVEAVKAILPEDDFAKIAKWKPEFVPEPIPAHWAITSSAHATVNSYINRWDGTPEGDLLKAFMTREKTGESLKIEYRKGVKLNVTPKAVR